MNPRPFYPIFCIFLATSHLSAAAPDEAKTLVEWKFGSPEGRAAWEANADFKIAAADGVLRGSGVGKDPILVLRTMLDLSATPRQFIELRIKADREGMVEVYWTNTDKGKYGGFDPVKRTPFRVAAGDWQICRIFPWWQSEKRIKRLRLDLYEGASFEIDTLRVRELPAAPKGGEVFEAADLAAGCRAMGEARLIPGPEGCTIAKSTRQDFMLAPSVSFDAASRPIISLRLTAGSGRHALLLFASDAFPGLHAIRFRLRPDGLEHVYNVEAGLSDKWAGKIVALGLAAGESEEGEMRLSRLAAASAPEGPADLEVLWFGCEEVLPRAGKETALIALVRNNGGEPPRRPQVDLRLPEGIASRGNGPDIDSLASLRFGERVEMRWPILAQTPVKGAARLGLRSAGGPATEASTALDITARPKAAAGAVPTPRPAKGKYDVGVYYFPGWQKWSRWAPIEGYPERKPALGWYREGDPEIADWHILWAVEHGITFFAYDWYWVRGMRHLEHGLHDGYFKARHRNLLKFCLLWANHNPAGTSSREDCLDVARYWIEHYFRRPEHFNIDGKPLMIIFSPSRLTADLGADKVRSVFDEMRAECRKAGLAGLHLAACVGNAAQAEEAGRQGYDSVTAYNWPGLGMEPGTIWAPFEKLLPAYRERWNEILGASTPPLLVPVSGGWDSRPWHGENKTVRFGRTPDLFRSHLLDARALLDERAKTSRVLPMILVEAWNEWGEGSYIEPHREFGFGYLDAIREIFAEGSGEQADVVPADVGLGPYDVPVPDPRRTMWEFDGDADGWGEDGMQLRNIRRAEGMVSAMTTGRDPAFFGPAIRVSAAGLNRLTVRMRLRAEDGKPFEDQGEFYWGTEEAKESASTCLRFAVKGDGEWHEYAVPLGEHRRWRGKITRLRLDPCSRAGIAVEIDHLRLQP